MSRRLPRHTIRLVLATLAALLLPSSQALGHAVLVSSAPDSGERLTTPPTALSLTFSETITLLAGSNVDVVDEQGRSVAAAEAKVSPTDAKVINQPLKSGLADGTYTVQFSIVSADSHTITGQYVFGIGSAPLQQAVVAKRGGPGETSPWSIAARLVEFICLGGLLGVLAFRWLVWRTPLRRLTPGTDTTRAANWVARNFWSVFGALAMVTFWAEGYLLVTKSASALGQSVWATIVDPSGIDQVLRDTRFGDWWQVRVMLLFAVFAIASWEFLAEPSADQDRSEATTTSSVKSATSGRDRPPAHLGRPIPTLLIGAALIVSIVSVSIQGHASTAPLSALQVAADAVHLTAVSIWVTGIALLAWALYRLPRVAGNQGRVLAARVLARFSRVATVAVAAVLATGTIRSVGELSAVSQLWETGYGRSIAVKIALLGPIGFLALRNRRVIAALAGVRQPNNATLTMVRRSVALEFTVAVAVVIVASLLVSQVPGRVQ